MGVVVVLLLSVFMLFLFFRLHKRRQFEHRTALIESYRFPDKLILELKKRYPHLSDGDCGLVVKGLREYFHISLAAKRRGIAMPSQVVDVAWHEFILFTRHYELFCKHAFGRFLHHTPAEAMSSPVQAQDGIKRAWRLACNREGINADKPNRLPLLFALDAKLAIKDGFVYKLDCKGLKDNGYCASHIGCGGGCSGGCSSDSDSSSGCSSGCGGD